MGQQNSCKTLIGMHSTMHLMHPIKVLQLLHVGLIPEYEVCMCVCVCERERERLLGWSR